MSNEPEIKKCGVVMPISAIDGCSEAHWSDVYHIIINAAKTAGFTPELVSYSDESGIIQKRIIQNLYNNPIVVCDVSGKNPNVMFELGMRLAFDKPTIVIKDDKTSYSFDTSPIEHLTYPRDLRYQSIVEFQDSLAQKIVATHKKAEEDTEYSTFLKHFGDFTVPKIKQETVSSDVYIMEQLRALTDSVQRLDRKAGRENALLNDFATRGGSTNVSRWANTSSLPAADILVKLNKGAEKDAILALGALECVETVQNSMTAGARALAIKLYDNSSSEHLKETGEVAQRYGEVTYLKTFNMIST